MGMSIRLKQVCARGNTFTFLSPYIVNLRMLPSLPCRSVDVWECDSVCECVCVAGMAEIDVLQLVKSNYYLIREANEIL